jgi:hypothetical protein
LRLYIETANDDVEQIEDHYKEIIHRAIKA